MVLTEDDSMIDTPTVHFKYNGADKRTLILYENGDSESLLLSPVGPDLFRLEESSLLGHGNYHDVIRASANGAGSFQFREVAARSGFQTESWILSKDLIESDEFSSILDWVISVGGNWERAFGGLILVHVPHHLADAVRNRVNPFLLSPRV
jgi:hypothetical protein